jgi:coronin-7
MMFDEGLKTIFVAGKGDTILRSYELVDLLSNQDHLSAQSLLDRVYCEKSCEFKSAGLEPIAGVCLLPKRACDFRNIEVARILKLTSDSVVPISYKVPRADHLKSYFHDDIFPAVRSKQSQLTVEDWTNIESPLFIFSPQMESLKPIDMISIADKPFEPAPSVIKSKIMSFKEEVTNNF